MTLPAAVPWRPSELRGLHVQGEDLVQAIGLSQTPRTKGSRAASAVFRVLAGWGSVAHLARHHRHEILAQGLGIEYANQLGAAANLDRQGPRAGSAAVRETHRQS
jgi:hypothetical protein